MSTLLELSPLLSLILLCAIGALFTLAAEAVYRRFGRLQLISFWIAASIVLGTAGTLRNLAMQRRLGIDTTRVIVPGLYALFIVASLVILSIPTIVVARQSPRASSRGLPRRIVAGACWTFVGLLLSIVVALVLDLANVRFIPFR